MKNKSVFAWILVVGQFGFFGALLFTGPFWGCNYWYMAMQGFSAVLVLWAAVVMNLHTLHVSPEIRNTARLVKSGPYSILRHPMYTAVLIYSVPLVLCQFSYLRLALLALLAVNLIIKLLFEESLLKAHYPDYREYMKKTWRLLPYIF